MNTTGNKRHDWNIVQQNMTEQVVPKKNKYNKSKERKLNKKINW